MPATESLAEAAQAHHRGEWNHAERIYREILESNPVDPSALHLLGLLLSERGDHEHALPLLSLSLQLHPRPAEAAAWVCNLGLATERAGRLDLAFRSFREAARLDKAYGEALVRFGRRRCEAGDNASGAEAFRSATEFDPESVLGWFHYGVAAMIERDFDSARCAFQQATRIDPASHESWNNLGDLEAARGAPAAAIACYRRAIAASPAYIPARYNLGLILQNCERTVESEAEYHALLDLDPRHADTLNNLGAIYLSRNRVREALDTLRAGVAADPNHVDCRWNLGLAHLALGDYRRGWARYEARLEQPGFPKREFAIPRWSGEDPAGRTIHVWAEQGLGDTIQFLRYLPMLTAKGARVTFEVQDRLLPLMPKLARRRGDVPAEAEFHCPLLSLPALIEGIPPVWDPFALGTAPEFSLPGLKVGLCWGANPDHVKGRHRSMHLLELAGLGGIPGYSFVALQRGPQLAELGQSGGLWKPHCVESEGGTIADLAAVIRTLDLVISVDTMIAHLAATLGKATWVMLPFAADWRWGLEREDSPWYPTMRLFRQNAPGDWTGVVTRVRTALEHRIDAWQDSMCR